MLADWADKIVYGYFGALRDAPQTQRALNADAGQGLPIEGKGHLEHEVLVALEDAERLPGLHLKEGEIPIGFHGEQGSIRREGGAAGGVVHG